MGALQEYDFPREMNEGTFRITESGFTVPKSIDAYGWDEILTQHTAAALVPLAERGVAGLDLAIKQLSLDQYRVPDAHRQHQALLVKNPDETLRQITLFASSNPDEPRLQLMRQSASVITATIAATRVAQKGLALHTDGTDPEHGFTTFSYTLTAPQQEVSGHEPVNLADAKTIGIRYTQYSKGKGVFYQPNGIELAFVSSLASGGCVEAALLFPNNTTHDVVGAVVTRINDGHRTKIQGIPFAQIDAMARLARTAAQPLPKLRG